MNTLLFHESPWIFVYLTISFGVIDYILGSKRKYYLVVLYFVLLGVMMFMYRVPFRINRYPKNLLVSPCDGRVMSILELNDITTHVAIYLNLLDSHVQWSPVNGVVLSTVHKQGTFNPAYMFHKSRYNERVETIIYVPAIDDEIKIVQIAGQLARRIVNYKEKNDRVERGELIGMIKFGSRVDLFIPHNKIDLLINVGDTVFGNKTIIGKPSY
jgi:phosphatidylserine decarboxylase